MNVCHKKDDCQLRLDDDGWQGGLGCLTGMEIAAADVSVPELTIFCVQAMDTRRISLRECGCSSVSHCTSVN
jgi:hypothetical protein